MKKVTHLFIALSVIFLVNTSNAQLYITAGGGYGFPANKQLLAWEYTADSNQETYTGVYGTFGAGILPSVTFGYMVNDWAGIEVGYSYLLGKQIVANYDDHSITNVTVTGTDEWDVRMSRILIGSKFMYGENSMKCYMRLGLVLGVGGKLTYGYNRTSQTPLGSSTTNSVMESTGGLAIGYSGALGACYNFSDMFGMFFEAGLVAQSWAPEKGVMTKYEVDGVDQLPNMTVRDKETVYVEELTISSSSSPSDSQPDEDIKQYLPMGSLGINIGIVIMLGGQ